MISRVLLPDRTRCGQGLRQAPQSLLLRYDARLVPSFAATVVLMTGAVKAAQAAAWLPFAFDALTTVLVCIALTRYLNQSTREPTAPA